MTTAVAVSIVLSTTVFAAQYAAQSVGGTTGLITTPTANVGYQNKKSTGIDAGYHHLAGFAGSANVVKATFSFFGRAELGGAVGNVAEEAFLFLGKAALSGRAVDIQGGDKPFHTDEIEIIVHGKFKIIDCPCSSLAIGANFQLVDLNNNYTDGKVIQLYLAYTFSKRIFSMPAETTFVIGKSFSPNNKIKAGYRKRDGESQLYLRIDDDDNFYTRTGNIDFSVGFDIDLLPRHLKGRVHWITDFANYSYSVAPMGALPNYRACANTGFRIIPLKLKNYKWNIDVISTDFLDHSREWAVGMTLGFGI